MKHVMFDSATGLIRRIAYTAREKGAAVRIETVYSGYSLVDGHLLPGEIRRLENGRESLRFVRTSAALRSSGGSGTFKQP